MRPITSAGIATLCASLFLGSVLPVAAQQGGTVHDVEPNNSPAKSTPAAIGDTLVGTIGPSDSDYFAFDVPAGTELSLATRAPESLYYQVYLIDRDGRTVLAGLGGDHPNDSPTTYPLTQAGRYYLSIVPRGNHEFPTPPGQPYWVTIDGGRLETGPGDPATVFAQDALQFGEPDGIVAARGDFYVVAGGNFLDHLTAQGKFSRLAESVSGLNLAVDGHGDLIVARPAPPGGTVHMLWRFSPSGAPSRFTADSMRGTFYGITVGPDGDVWAGAASRTGEGTQYIWRFDPQGRVKDSLPLADYDGIVRDLAFSPAGQLHYITDAGLYRQPVTGARQLVVPYSSADFHGLAFDRDGYFYLIVFSRDGTRQYERIVRYTPSYQVAQDPVAIVPSAIDIVFARDQNGAMTRRLLVAEAASRRIVELNPAGVRAPGWRIGTDLPSSPQDTLTITTTSLRPGVVGATYADTVRATGASGDVTWKISSGKLPSGISLATVSGIVSGIPTDSGSFGFDVQAKNGSSTATKTLTLVIAAAQGSSDSVVVDAAPLEAGVIGTDYADTLKAVNATDPVTWTISSGTLPPGLHLSAATGIIAGMPSDTGSFAFDVAGSSGPSTGTGHFTILIQPVPVSVDEVTQALFGAGTLNQGASEYLDRQGNHNGQVDVGDLRAFLRARGMLPGDGSPTRNHP